MILHIVATSPFCTDALQRCLQLATTEDAILLIEDAVLALHGSSDFFATSPTQALFALEPDCLARAMTPSARFTKVNYEGFVDLVAQYDKSVSWY